MRLTRLCMDWLRACVAAFQFLTRLPIPLQIDYNEAVFRRSVVFYPLAGAVIGGLLYGAGALLTHLLPPLPAAALLLGLWIALTGGLHLDGLMDTADGVLSHRSRERMLEIMKDSRVGAMGVIVCVMHVLVKLSLLYTWLEMLKSDAGGSWRLGIILAPMWSRWFMVAAIQGWPYARKEAGLGSLFQSVTPRFTSASLGVALLTTTLVACIAGQGVSEASQLLLGAALLTVLAGVAIGAYFARKLGGQTGDTYGALNELLESVILLGSIIAMLHI
ncbi:adenosylcobinamide-GDP ribazoletransferase [Paenibacillus oryzisoli]|uniref:adenosylcobinamide-GDP ribazoletransferase n=1 Tax=Paenibacillus oryzisoli TaxID=1850517 RepID=UPI003D2CF16E